MSDYIIKNGELYHWGVKGMKWGVRKKSYKSTSIKAALAKRSNTKVDKGFENWKDNDAKKKSAIDLGKKANVAKMAYEKDSSNKELKRTYKEANKAYKKALSENTTYRKGAIRQEVGRDAARKYLSEAKRVKKSLDQDASNTKLQKKYNDLMSKHDIERANARRAAGVGVKRSSKVASIKRSMTIGVTTLATSAAVAAGAYAVNRYLNKHQVTYGGKSVSIGSKTIRDIVDVAKKVKSALGYAY